MNIGKEAENVVVCQQKYGYHFCPFKTRETNWVRICKEMANADDPIAYDEIMYEMKVVGQELIDEAEKWTPRTPVLVNADMGAGKTSFAKKTAKKGYKETGKSSAIISPRIAIGAQTAVELLEAIVGKEKM